MGGSAEAYMKSGGPYLFLFFVLGRMLNLSGCMAALHVGRPVAATTGWYLHSLTWGQDRYKRDHFEKRLHTQRLQR